MKPCIFIMAALFLVASPVVSRAKPLAATKPNVLFISIDDLNNDLGCYGNAQVRSPNIDRLAARGLRFERAYAQYTLCNPSRASFLSGRRPETTRIFELQTPPRKAMPDAVFLPQLFRQHGYFTARYGKVYHEGRDDKLSWDVTESVEFTDAQERAMHQRRYDNPPGQRTPDWTPLDTPEAQTRDARIARALAQLIEEKAKAGKPFFLAAGLNKPHLPWNVPKDYFTRYRAADLRVQADAPLRNIPPVALMTELFGSPQPASRAEAMAAYYSAITYMDKQVGVLLATLDRLNLWDNTVVVLFSDHGFHLGDHGGLWAKLTLFEQAARAPLIIAAPHSKHAGKASPRVVELLDLYPTLAELCRLPLPPGLEGRSLAPLLSQPNRSWPYAAYTMVYHEVGNEKIEGKSVRNERWRYTEWDAGRRGVELYDHARDPREFSNLAAHPRYQKTVRTMKQLLAVGK
ncbi:MAG: sulfatase [Blastocatellia bacterium]